MGANQIDITAEPFSPEEKIAAFRSQLKKAGAIVAFTGIVRDQVSTKENPDTVTGLHLQHFPGFTEKQISAFSQTAVDRFEIEDFLIIHRVGTMTPCEPIVLVAVASAHRRAAFEAADYLMDYLKTSAPFWKKEICGDQSDWIEPRSNDYQDLARWKQQN